MNAIRLLATRRFAADRSTSAPVTAPVALPRAAAIKRRTARALAGRDGDDQGDDPNASLGARDGDDQGDDPNASLGGRDDGDGLGPLPVRGESSPICRLPPADCRV